MILQHDSSRESTSSPGLHTKQELALQPELTKKWITHPYQNFTKPPPHLNIPQILTLYPEIGSIQHFQRSAGNPSFPLEKEVNIDNTKETVSPEETVSAFEIS